MQKKLVQFFAGACASRWPPPAWPPIMRLEANSIRIGRCC